MKIKPNMVFAQSFEFDEYDELCVKLVNQYAYGIGMIGISIIIGPVLIYYNWNIMPPFCWTGGILGLLLFSVGLDLCFLRRRIYFKQNQCIIRKRHLFGTTEKITLLSQIDYEIRGEALLGPSNHSPIEYGLILYLPSVRLYLATSSEVGELEYIVQSLKEKISSIHFENIKTETP